MGWDALRAPSRRSRRADIDTLPDAQADVCRIGGMFVLTLEGEQIAAITRFGEGGWVGRFGLPRTLPGRPEGSGGED